MSIPQSCGTKSIALLNRFRRLALREFDRERNEAYAKGLRHKAQGIGQKTLFKFLCAMRPGPYVFDSFNSIWNNIIPDVEIRGG